MVFCFLPYTLPNTLIEDLQEDQPISSEFQLELRQGMVYTPKLSEVDALVVSPLSLLVFDLILTEKDCISLFIKKHKSRRDLNEREGVSRKDILGHSWRVIQTGINSFFPSFSAIT